jgi:hypothetical protein
MWAQIIVFCLEVAGWVGIELTSQDEGLSVREYAGLQDCDCP